MMDDKSLRRSKTAWALTLVLAASAFAALLLAGPADGIEVDRPTHMDRFKLKKTCSACHSGSGAAGTPLLREAGKGLCFRCHGWNDRAGAGADIESVFSKFSVHPVYETEHYHRVDEDLPERYVTVARHVSCFDCHVVHVSDPQRPWKGSRGYAPGTVRGIAVGGLPPGLRVNRASYEYEVCYLCHSDSANLPPGSKNVAAEFDPDNMSYHPVEMEGRNRDVPSLVRRFNEASRLSCGDCHGNSDFNGPRGPHGSDYAPLLLAEYRTADGPETPKAYELCYLCHDRSSIIGDDSFKRHSLHVVQNNTSCHTCHASHGSLSEANLMSFDPSVVSASANIGGPSYMPGPGGMPTCYLSCHGVDHNSTDVAGRPWPW